VSVLRLEPVTTNALVNNDADNQWGGHKLRIIRMSDDDIYTAYSTATAGGALHNQWNLAKRTANGTWSVVATGMAGREPVNLLRGPRDQIYLVSWDGGLPSLTTSTDGVHFSTQAIPGSWPRSDWPYSGAAIAPNGDIYVLQSDWAEKPGKLYVGYQTAADCQWHFTTIATDYRYCYDYLFPTADGRLQVLGVRDVQWATLGWTQPADGFSYTFNGLRQFRTTDISSQPFSNTLVAVDNQTAALEDANTPPRDVYVDASGIVHITYLREGADTSGSYVAHVATVDSSGTVLKDVAVPGGANQPRLYQSPTDERFYVISNQGQVYPAGADGTQYGSPVTLDLQGYHIYGPNGVFLAAPRGGTPQSNIVDGVFATSSGGWVYIRIQLP
jgi:hypothetical protein